MRCRLILSVAAGGLLLGCSEAPRPEANVSSSPATETRADAPREAVVVVESPELKSVPASSASRAREVFAAIIQAAEAGDAEAWTKSEGELHDLGLAALPALSERLGDANGVARELAAMFLAQLGPDAAPAADGLLKLLDDPSTFARVNAAAALSTFDGHAERIVPVLTSLLEDEDVNVRITAATSLRNAGSVAAQSITALTRSLEDVDARVRAAAAATLGEIGPSASSSLSALKRLDSDEDEQVQAAANRAIKRIDESARSTPVTIPASATE